MADEPIVVQDGETGEHHQFPAGTPPAQMQMAISALHQQRQAPALDRFQQQHSFVNDLANRAGNAINPIENWQGSAQRVGGMLQGMMPQNATEAALMSNPMTVVYPGLKKGYEAIKQNAQFTGQAMSQGDIPGVAIGIGSLANPLAQGAPSIYQQAAQHPGQAVGAGAVDVAGMLAGNADWSNALPSRMKAAALLEQTKNVAGKAVPPQTPALSQLGDIALRIKELDDAGHGAPTALKKFLNDATRPNSPAMNFNRLRDTYEAVTKLTAKDKVGATDTMKYQVGQFAGALDTVLRETASQEGVGGEYAQGMKGYARAMALRRSVEGAGKLAAAAIPKVAAGAAAYELLKGRR